MGFQALVTDKSATGDVSSEVRTLQDVSLPDGDVVVAVEWAGLNYKDALCLNGLGNLVKSYPHVAGIDFAGRVVESRNARYHPGQAVILTGWRVGETRWGGYAQRARVDAGWLVNLPKKLSTRNAMVLG
ncbi:MAG: oxidoreductase, partial [Hyphomicrobiales bacterium]